MPIDIERFEGGAPEDLSEPTNAERVLAFLGTHDDRAWKQSEIAEHTGVKRGSVGPVLTRLLERGLVRHRGEYWAVTDDDDLLAAAVEAHRVTEALDEQHGTEDRAEWLAHAEESREE